MKQLKFLMVAFTLLMGISLTSCLDSDSDPYSYGYGYAKVVNSYGATYFTMGKDITITPSSGSVATLLANGIDISKMTNHVVYITYRWDPALINITTETKDLQGVDLMGALDLNNRSEIVEEKGAANDSVNTAPIISLTSSQSSEVKPIFYDATTLLIPANYYMYSKIHYLTLKYYPNEETEDNKLRLYLHHNAKGDESTSATSTNYAQQGYLGFLQKAYDLTGIFARYALKHGGTRPTTLEIVTLENPYSVKLDDAQTKEKVYTVTYEEKTDK